MQSLPIPIEKLKNSQGVYLTKSLFFETSPSDKTACVFTLKGQEHQGLPSLKKLYLDLTLNDTTEYTFANEVFGSWEHWVAISSMRWFKDDYLTLWRDERDIRAKSLLLKIVLDEANNKESRFRVGAAKYLIEIESGPKAKSQRGRPSNDEIKRAALDMARSNETLDDDYSRIIPFNRAAS